MQRPGDGLEFSPMAEVLKNVRCIDGIESTVANPVRSRRSATMST